MSSDEHQHTIAGDATLQGCGLFSGTPVNLTFHPAPANHGIVFRRTDLDGAQVPALIQHVVKRPRRTAVKNGLASVETCEHCLSALAGLNIDNVLIDLDGPEVPAMDGSSLPFYEALAQAGVESLDAERRRLVITKPITVKMGDAMIAAVPCDEPQAQLLYELDYSALNASIGRQVHHFDFSNGDYAHEIAPARTFSLKEEALAAQQAGMFQHLTPDEALVIDEQGPMGTNAFRFEDEPVRHKMLDLLGDLYLLGAPIQGRIIAHKSGHPLNHMMVRKLVEQYAHQSRQLAVRDRTHFDLRQINRILPHRYPMLLVDRVIEVQGNQRAVGIKNVSINEPFFQGHYPGTPIMPGVLIVEAMAQLSGVLIGQKLENTGKLAVLLSLDRVKLRRPVVPGDQLILEAEAVRIRSRIAQMRCHAYVNEDLAAEAEVKFMLVDDDQE